MNCFDENPHVVLEKDFKAGVWPGGIIGPIFCQENITGDVYLNLSRAKIMPAILEHCPPDVVLQQDGASLPHYAVQVRQLLDEHFFSLVLDIKENI